MTDLTLAVTPRMTADAMGNERIAFNGHLGTHFDVMDKVFPLDYTELEGIVFDIEHVGEGEVQVTDVDLSMVKEKMFVAFHSHFIEKHSYGSKHYFHEHPQLSHELIDALIARKVAIIGIDFAGVRRGKQHTPTDQRCADNGIFIIENLCNLSTLLCSKATATFKAHTYPMNFLGMTGLPCRVVADKREYAGEV